MVPLQVGHLVILYAPNSQDQYPTFTLAYSHSPRPHRRPYTDPHFSKVFSINPAPTVVPIRADDRGKRRVLRVRPYPVDLNGTAKENTEATGSFMRRRDFGGIGGCRDGGG